MNIVKTLNSMIRRAKDLRDLQDGRKQDAFLKAAHACAASRAYRVHLASAALLSVHPNVVRDLKREEELAHQWAEVSAAFLHIDSRFSHQCLEIVKYWTDPDADPVRDDGRLAILFDSLSSACHPGRSPTEREDKALPVTSAFELMGVVGVPAIATRA